MQVSVCVYVCMYVCIYVCIHRRALVVDRETNAQTELNTQYVPRCVHDTEAPQTISYQPPGETRPGAITKNTWAWAVNDYREQIWRPTLGYDTTGKMRNILQKTFRTLLVLLFCIPSVTLTHSLRVSSYMYAILQPPEKLFMPS